MKENMVKLFENGFDLVIFGFVMAALMLLLIVVYGELMWAGSDVAVWLFIPISVTETVMAFASVKLLKMELKSRMEES